MKHDEVDQLTVYVRCQLAGLVRDLRLMLRDDGLVLQGRACSYYGKQLAQEVAMKAAGVPVLANEIDVLEPPPIEENQS